MPGRSWMIALHGAVAPPVARAENSGSDEEHRSAGAIMDDRAPRGSHAAIWSRGTPIRRLTRSA